MKILGSVTLSEAEKLVNYFDITYVPGTSKKVGTKYLCHLKIG